MIRTEFPRRVCSHWRRTSALVRESTEQRIRLRASTCSCSTPTRLSIRAPWSSWSRSRSATGIRHLRRADVKPRRNRQPWLLLGTTHGLESRLLRVRAVDRVQALAALRPGVARPLAAGQRPRGGHRDGLPAPFPANDGTSSAEFDTLLHVRGRGRFRAPSREAGLRPIITPDSVITHEVGASSKVRSDKVILLYRERRRSSEALERSPAVGRARTPVAGRRAARDFRKLMPRAERQSVWPQVWGPARRWFAGYPNGGRARRWACGAPGRDRLIPKRRLRQSDGPVGSRSARTSRRVPEAERRDDEEDQRGLNERERIEEAMPAA